MSTLFLPILANIAIATVLALIAAVVTRHKALPGLALVLWVMVLVKLVTPPLVPIGIVPPSASSPPSPVDEESSVDTNPDALAATWHDDDSVIPFASSDFEIASTMLPDQAFGSVEQTDQGIVTPVSMSLRSPTHWILGCWIIGSLITLGIVFRRAVQFHRQLQRNRQHSASLTTEAQTTAGELGLARGSQVYLVDANVPPLLWPGLTKAQIYLSRSLAAQLTKEERRMIFAHELAHFARRDSWRRWFETAVVALYWWLPLVWIARRHLQALEDRCCDAWTLRRLSGADRKSYASLLLRTVDFLNHKPIPHATLACGFGKPINKLKTRFEMILNPQILDRLTKRQAALCASVALLALPVSAQLVSATADPDESKPKTTSTPTLQTPGAQPSVPADSGAVRAPKLAVPKVGPLPLKAQMPPALPLIAKNERPLLASQPKSKPQPKPVLDPNPHLAQIPVEAPVPVIESPLPVPTDPVPMIRPVPRPATQPAPDPVPLPQIGTSPRAVPKLRPDSRPFVPLEMPKINYSRYDHLGFSPLSPSHYDSMPTAFAFDYAAEPIPGVRQWKRYPKDYWTETYPNGQQSLFHIFARTTVDGIPGSVGVKIAGDEGTTGNDNQGGQLVFVPDAGHDKQDFYFMKISRGDREWNNLATLSNIRGPNVPVARPFVATIPLQSLSDEKTLQGLVTEPAGHLKATTKLMFDGSGVTGEGMVTIKLRAKPNSSPLHYSITAVPLKPTRASLGPAPRRAPSETIAKSEALPAAETIAYKVPFRGTTNYYLTVSPQPGTQPEQGRFDVSVRLEPSVSRPQPPPTPVPVLSSPAELPRPIKAPLPAVAPTPAPGMKIEIDPNGTLHHNGKAISFPNFKALLKKQAKKEPNSRITVMPASQAPLEAVIPVLELAKSSLLTTSSSGLVPQIQSFL